MEEAGAGGYVLKNTPFHELQSVIELVTRGGDDVLTTHCACDVCTSIELAQTSASSVTHEPVILSDREWRSCS